MRIVALTEETKKNLLQDLLKRSPSSYGQYEGIVNDIIANVREKKDSAVFDYTKQFDHCDINADNIVVTKEEIQEAYTRLDADFIETMKKSAANVRDFHEKQLRQSFFTTKPDGSILGQRITPLSRAGVYVPGGKAAYPSSVLMNVIPAKVAGVSEVVMTTPPGQDGKVNPGTLVAADIAGVDKIYKVVEGKIEQVKQKK